MRFLGVLVGFSRISRAVARFEANGQRFKVDRPGFTELYRVSLKFGPDLNKIESGFTLIP